MHHLYLVNFVVVHGSVVPMCCYSTPKPYHDDSNNSLSFYSMDSCMKLLEEYEERFRRIICGMKQYLEKRIKLMQDVYKFGMHTHNLSNELTTKVIMFDAQ